MKLKHFLAPICLILTVMVLNSCKSDKKQDLRQTATTQSDHIFDFSDGYHRKNYTKEQEKYTLTPVKNSKKYDKAKLENFTYKDGVVHFDVSNYELGIQTPNAQSMSCANSAKGQHIHFIVDEHPYAAKYTSEFEYDIPNGQHYVMAFLSRSYHESIKTPDAAIYKFIEVRDGNIIHEWDIPGPAIFFSRPKGTYVGVDTKRVLLDFYPVNCEIGKDAFIEVYINGEYKILDKWQAYFIEGLPYGQNTVALRLVDGNGEQISQRQTAIRKEIILERDPALAE